MRRRFDRTTIVVLSSMTVLYLILFGYYIGATALRVPVVDVIFWVLHYMDYWLKGDWWGYLWIDHNAHRLVFSRLLMIAVLQWPGGSVMPFILFGVACFTLMIGALVLEVMAADLPSVPRAAIALGVVLLLATSFSAIDCGAPQLGVYLHSCAFAVLALVLWDGRDESGRHAAARRVGALAAGVLASFGVNGGMLVLPVLAWAAWRGGFGRRWIVAALLALAALVAVYVPHTKQDAIVTSFDADTLLRAADYVIRFFGLPWSHLPALLNLGRVVGLATVAASVYVVLRFGIFGRPRSRLDRIALGVVLFGLLIAAAVTEGRLNTAPERPMPIRYALFTSLTQTGLLLIAAPWLCRLWYGLRLPVVQATALAGAVLFLVQQVLGGEAGALGVQQYTAAYRAYETGNETPAQRDMVGSWEYVGPVLAYLHAHGLFRAEH